MHHFNFIHSKFASWIQSDAENFTLNGMTPAQFGLYLKSHFNLLNKNMVLICENGEQAEDVFDLLKNDLPVLYFPEIVDNPYSSIIPPEKNLLKQIYALDKLSHRDSKFLIVSTLKAIRFGTFSPDFLALKTKVQISDIISPVDLAQKLTNLGYSSSASVEEPGTFSKKGEIFDIYPVGQMPIRIHYFDDMIEEAFAIDKTSGKTLKDQPIDEIEIVPSPHALTTEKYATQFRGNILKPNPSLKEQYYFRKEVLRKLSEGNLFTGYINHLPLFFDQHYSIKDYLDESDLFITIDKDNNDQKFELYLEHISDYYEHELQDKYTENLIPEPGILFNTKQKLLKEVFLNNIGIGLDLNGELEHKIELKLEPANNYFNRKKTEIGLKIDKTNTSLNTKNKISILREFKNKGQLTILYKNDKSIEQIKYLFENNGFSKAEFEKIELDHYPILEGFYHREQNHFYLAEGDLFTVKKEKANTSTEYDFDIFAEQFSKLDMNDFVIHRDFGIGRYQGMEKLKVGTNESDCIVIEYDGGDKVYVPVYKFNLVQKHAEQDATIKLSNLNSKKYQNAKSKAKSSIKKLAVDLLKIQAKRQTQKGFIFSPPDENYIEFEETFPYKETADQLKAIEDVIHDMTQVKPMDRLICGDVGFGKTEVAMRAAFKAVLDHKQVAILVPTTILAFQHYNSFVERMKNFAINVELISRFRSPKQTKEILEKVSAGKIDILIGTHKILSKQLEFHDLGLVIIDEEHRFGVNHKEKLKDLKNNIDVLTMTATPIPRTLQLSFLGIRDLSIIKTPPPKRQSIKSYLIKEDNQAIKEAIEKEISRGGQIYYVYNRVSDINDLAAKLKKLVPSASFLVAHGQLSETDLEKKIRSFYNGEYDVLVSTTIIESGIDIPRANTMIVHNAQNFGLAQLHQLRGRIGRSDRKAYAYFMIPKARELNEVASKRLKALQTFADMGSGFSIATSDLEIRGAGDILGAEQSGHIGEIGLEYYMDLLKEAVAELKGEIQTTPLYEIEVKTPFASQIPKDYIEDDHYRLKTYKRLSNASSFDSIDEILRELQDQFGIVPESLNELISILKVRVLARDIYAKAINTTKSHITFRFDQDLLNSNAEIRDRIINVFMKEPGRFKIQPDYSVKAHFKKDIDHEKFLNFVHDIAQQIKP